MRGVFAALVSVVAMGCQRTSPRLFLPVEDGVQSVVVVAEAGDDLEVHAFEVNNGASVATLWDPYIGLYRVAFTSLSYTESLNALGLLAGPIELAATGRAFPPTTRLHAAMVEGDDVVDFEMIAELPASVAGVRIAGDADLACVAAGGCYVSGSAAEQTCVQPCPAIDDPQTPIPATPPSLGPCATGFTAREIDVGIEICEPLIDGRDRSCPLGFAHFIDTDGCSRIGPECPTNFPAGLPADTIYVSEGASGNGASTSPFGTVADAIAAATSGQTIALARGRYVSPAAVDGLRIVGACLSRTTMARDPAGDGRVYLRGDAALIDVRLQELGVVVERDARVLIRNVEVYRARVSGIRSTETSSITLDTVVITQPAIDGMSFWNGPDVTARRIIVTGLRGTAVIVHNGRLLLEGAVFDDIETTDDNYARGLQAQGGSTVTVRRTLMDGIPDAAVFADDSTATFDQVVVRDSVPTAAGEDDGYGFFLQNEAEVTIRRTWVHQSRHANVFANTSVLIEDTVLSNALPQAGGEVSGIGMKGVGPSSQTLRRVAVLDSAFHAIQFTADGNTAEDTIVRRTGVQRSDGREGRGFNIVGSATIRRAEIEDTQGAGIRFVGDVGGLFQDSTVDDVRVRRAGLIGCASCGGICSDETVSFQANRVEVNDVSGLGLGQLINVAVGESIGIEDAVVRNAKGPSCARDAFSPRLSHGVGVQAIGELTLRSFLIEGSASSGLALRDTEGTVRFGTIRSNRVGVSLTRRPDQPWRLFDRVHIVDNEVPLDVP